MKVELKYIYELKKDGGFKFVFDTPEKALEHFDADYKELQEIVKAIKNDSKEYNYCYASHISTKELTPHAKIYASIKGEFFIYELRTEITRI